MASIESTAYTITIKAVREEFICDLLRFVCECDTNEIAVSRSGAPLQDLEHDDAYDQLNKLDNKHLIDALLLLVDEYGLGPIEYLLPAGVSSLDEIEAQDVDIVIEERFTIIKE